MKLENVIIAAILTIGLLASAALAAGGTGASAGSMTIDTPAKHMNDPIPVVHDQATAFDLFRS